MTSGRNSFLISVIAAILTSACVTTQPDNVSSTNLDLPPKSQFWRAPTDRRACRGPAQVDALPLQHSTQGWRPGNQAVAFIDLIGVYLAGALSNEDFAKAQFANEIVRAADASAFTAADFDRPRGPSPTFMQSMVLISLSYALSYLDQESLLNESDRQKVIQWGNTIYASTSQRSSTRTLDHIAADAAAGMAWGAVTSQNKIFRAGLSEFHDVAGRMGRHGQIESNPRDNNEDIQFLVLAAEAATRNGIRAYEFSYQGRTLHDAVRWHAENTLKVGHQSYYEPTVGYSDPYFRGHGFVAHIAWVPIYLSRFHDHLIASTLREMLSRVGDSISGTSMGGPTECLWGWNRQPKP